jgi:choline-sulfatase
VGAFGSTRGLTPNLDAVAARGVAFDNAFTTAPLTLPAHASMLTGLLPFRHGARVNGADSLAPGIPSIAERFHDAGAATGAVVGSLVLRSEAGLARGFDSYDDRFAENAGRTVREWNARRTGDEVVDRAVGWLAGHSSGRFFLWVHLYDAHAPYAAPAPFAERFGRGSYEASVAYADACLGRLLAELARLHLSQRTVIVVAADHGESLGEHGETTHGVFLYDATLRVPLVLYRPDAPRPRRVSTPVSLADVAPTLAEAGNVALSAGDGSSLWPVAAGPAGDRAVYAESVYPAALLGWSPLRCMRSARAKLVEAPRPELYDLAADPGERLNVFGPDRSEARALGLRMAAIRASRPAGNSARAAGHDVLRLASLGYLTPSGLGADLDRIDAARTDPKDSIAAWDRIERAIIARQSGRPGEGAALLAPVVASGVSSPAVLRELALCLRRSGRAAAAIRVYERLAAIPDATAEDLFGLGVCWHELGRDDRAASAHERAVRRDSSDMDSWIDLGQELVTVGRWDEAFRAFDAARRLDPAGVDALAGLAAVAFEKKDFGLAGEMLRRACALAPDRPDTLENLARVERALGNFEEAHRIEARLASMGRSPSGPPMFTRARHSPRRRTT